MIDITELIFRAEQGNAHAQYELGLKYNKRECFPEKGSNEDAAIYWLNRAAEQDHYEAQMELWYLYSHIDQAKAKYWEQRSIETGTKILAKKGDSGGCYIATAVYGSYDAPEVLYLRQFRDYTLSSSIFGRLFIKFYYLFSPPIAKRLRNARYINTVVRKILDMFVHRKSK